MIDYLIVGSGIAGICFAETAFQNGKSFLVVEDFSSSSSKVAGGLYNPVILKRFSQVWQATQQLEYGLPFYANVEKRLNVTFDYKIPVYRKFASIEEQNNWFQAADKPSLSPFLSTRIIQKKYQSISSDFGFGEVLHTGYVDTAVFISSYGDYLQSNNLILNETFDYSQLEILADSVMYKNIEAKHVIFAEGFGLQHNPYFNQLPLDGTKGELLIIKAPDLNLDVVLKSSIFILPIGNDLFKVGATYNWDDKTDTPTEEGKNELIENLKELIDCDFEIVNHFAGVRPTVKDRRPLVGTHAEFGRLHILNGLGTRGVMLGPSLAKDLFENIENNVPLDIQIDIKRFDKRKR
ncbi:glycine/D-amino acid oxidases (deaminating) family protein [Flavobacterium limnosediminis JC2902]|uniref:Glycine/D-amino acid oxidases (Deaminating) family protein n=1 Tax=Flavobacterium limnosediminis JC2902 TaxID=1341181 RepID=V6SY66_9FLAO|nr:FAD-dependent oxidoreductase [Flavobacterium limnosediminis]ESU29355.1 glycine/D-amino acid oxidases (deaminating) family protein [Flavobacterium limnosediminis JC2902]